MVARTMVDTDQGCRYGRTIEREIPTIEHKLDDVRRELELFEDRTDVDTSFLRDEEVRIVSKARAAKVVLRACSVCNGDPLAVDSDMRSQGCPAADQIVEWWMKP